MGWMLESVVVNVGLSEVAVVQCILITLLVVVGSVVCGKIDLFVNRIGVAVYVVV